MLHCNINIIYRLNKKMRKKSNMLSVHGKEILALLASNSEYFTAYEILAHMKDRGVKAAPTVYRALEKLLELHHIHRLESVNGYVACRQNNEGHLPQFTICKECKTVSELCDSNILNSIDYLLKEKHFHMEKEIVELQGLCGSCCPSDSH
jgi:Fur family zinc uptake transcriptional regulator